MCLLLLLLLLDFNPNRLYYPYLKGRYAFYDGLPITAFQSITIFSCGQKFTRELANLVCRT